MGQTLRRGPIWGERKSRQGASPGGRRREVTPCPAWAAGPGSVPARNDRYPARMSARDRSLPLAIILGAALAGGAAPAAASDSSDSGGYANPQVESHFLGTITIENSAMLDATGKPYDSPYAGDNVHYHSALYRLLAHTYVESGRKISFKTDAASEDKYRKAIQQYPRFPFGYYALALSLRARGDPSWRDLAQQGVVVFEQTTAKAGCNPSHFAALKELRGYLAQSIPSR
jgi:hypothetical protein